MKYFVGAMKIVSFKDVHFPFNTDYIEMGT